MSYRKITVDGKQFEYVIGKSHTKVKDVGIFVNSKIGEMQCIPQYCECCGEHMSQIRDDWKDPQKLAVTPKHVAKAIQSLVV